MLQRLSIVLAFLWMSTSVTVLRADVVVFGSDPSKSTELADMVNKNTDMRNALAAFERGDVAECERLLGLAIKSDKDLPSVSVMIARLLIQKGQFNEALTRLEQQLMGGGQDAEAHATMGEIAFIAGRYTDAWLQFREALSILKTSSTLSKGRKEAFATQLLQLRAQTAERRKDLSTAQTLYKELETAMPQSGLPLVAQARILISNADITRGVELLRRAKKLDNSVPQPELQIAKVLASGKDYVETEKWFRDGIKQTETVTIDNWFEYLKWLMTRDRSEDVRFLIQKAPAKYQTDRSIRFLDAMALRFQGKTDEAEKAFSILLSENISDMEASDQLALILVDSIDQGKKIRAQQLSQTNLRRAPNEESAVATAAWVEFSLGATDLADQYLNSLIARGTSNPQTIYYVARILESRGRIDEAMYLYKNAVELPGLFVQRLQVKDKLAGGDKSKPGVKDDKSKNNSTTPNATGATKPTETYQKASGVESKSSTNNPSKSDTKEASKQPANSPGAAAPSSEKAK